VVKKMVIPEPEPTPAPARVTVGERILARMEAVLAYATAQEERLVRLEYQIGVLNSQIQKMDETLLALDTVLANMQEEMNRTRNSANAAKYAAEEAGKEVDNLSKRMPDVEEVVDHIRSQERIEWLASLKPAF
jgi:methyl-accepting chemotaxis protein